MIGNRTKTGRKAWPVTFWRALALLAMAVMLAPLMNPAPAQAADELIEEVSSSYNNIYVYRRGSEYILTFGHNRRFYTETIYDSKDELALPVPYTRFMTAALAYADTRDAILEIGSGGGRTAWYLHKHLPATEIVTVELDPAVHRVATKYFGIKDSPKFRNEVADGRRYLVREDRQWDIIMVDAYRGPFVPFHLLTKEFFELAKGRLKKGGVMIQNIEPTTMAFDAAISTIKQVFDNVDLYQAEGNIVAVAYSGPAKTQADLLARAETIDREFKLRYPLTGLLARRRIMTKPPTGKVLTDDFAPVESLLAIEKHNRKWDDFTTEPKR